MTDQPLQPRDGPVPPRLMLQYLIVLAGTNPLVWRRIRVPRRTPFGTSTLRFKTRWAGWTAISTSFEW